MQYLAAPRIVPASREKKTKLASAVCQDAGSQYFAVPCIADARQKNFESSESLASTADTGGSCSRSRLFSSQSLPQTPSWGTHASHDTIDWSEEVDVCTPCLPEGVDTVSTTYCVVCRCIFGPKYGVGKSHPCHVCKASVCTSCSPSRIEFEGRVERVCTPCAATVHQPVTQYSGAFGSTESEMANRCCTRITSVLDRMLPELRFGWSEALDCHCCGSMLGKRRLKPRHHCRVCKESVCGTCSQSHVMWEGEESLQRICRHCVTSLYQDRSSEQALPDAAQKLMATPLTFSDRTRVLRFHRYPAAAGAHGGATQHTGSTQRSESCNKADRKGLSCNCCHRPSQEESGDQQRPAADSAGSTGERDRIFMKVTKTRKDTPFDVDALRAQLEVFKAEQDSQEEI